MADSEIFDEVEAAVDMAMVERAHAEHEDATAEAAEAGDDEGVSRKRRRAGAGAGADEAKKGRKGGKKVAPPEVYKSTEQLSLAVASLYRGWNDVKTQRKAITEKVKELNETERRVCATLVGMKKLSIKVNGVEFHVATRLKEAK